MQNMFDRLVELFRLFILLMKTIATRLHMLVVGSPSLPELLLLAVLTILWICLVGSHREW